MNEILQELLDPDTTIVGLKHGAPMVYHKYHDENSNLVRVVSDPQHHEFITKNWVRLGFGVAQNIIDLLYDLYIVEQDLVQFVELCPCQRSTNLMIAYLINNGMVDQNMVTKYYTTDHYQLSGYEDIKYGEMSMFGLVDNPSPAVLKLMYCPMSDRKQADGVQYTETFKFSVYEITECLENMPLFEKEYVFLHLEDYGCNVSQLKKIFYQSNLDVALQIVSHHRLQPHDHFDINTPQVAIDTFRVHSFNAIVHGTEFDWKLWLDDEDITGDIWLEMFEWVVGTSKQYVCRNELFDPVMLFGLMIKLIDAGASYILSSPVVNNWVTSKGNDVYKIMTREQRHATYHHKSNIGDFEKEWVNYDL